MELRGEKNNPFLKPATMLIIGGFVYLAVSVRFIVEFFIILSAYRSPDPLENMNSLEYMYAPASMFLMVLLAATNAICGMYGLTAGGVLRIRLRGQGAVIYIAGLLSLCFGLIGLFESFEHTDMLLLPAGLVLAGILYLLGGRGVFPRLRDRRRS